VQFRNDLNGYDDTNKRPQFHTSANMITSANLWHLSLITTTFMATAKKCNAYEFIRGNAIMVNEPDPPARDG
jgi:hypothetical protein